MTKGTAHVARLLTGLALVAALAACATPETRVRSALVSAGLPKTVAACMADRIVDRLSPLQLRKLDGLGKLRDRNAGDITINEFVKRTKALQDPEILTVVTSSGVVCAF